MFHDSGAETRRTVLKTIGGALGVASFAGAASGATTNEVSTGDCVYADGSGGGVAVYDQCDDSQNDPVGRVANYEEGKVEKVCVTLDGTTFAYVVWRDAAPNGWVAESQLTPCVTTT